MAKDGVMPQEVQELTLRSPELRTRMANAGTKYLRDMHPLVRRCILAYAKHKPKCVEARPGDHKKWVPNTVPVGQMSASVYRVHPRHFETGFLEKVIGS